MKSTISVVMAATIAMTTVAVARAPTVSAQDHLAQAKAVQDGAVRDKAPAAPITHAAGDLSASSLVGAPVYNANNDRIGEIEDLIISSNGSVTSVVVGMGGFLGIGERKVAMPFDAVRAEKGDNNALKFVIQASEGSLKELPNFSYASS